MNNWLILLLTIAGLGCSSDEAPSPPALSGSTVATGGLDPASTDVGGGGGDAGLGLTLYNASCAGCHSDIDTSDKKGATSDSILGAADLAFHGGVNPWPDATESANLEAALAE